MLEISINDLTIFVIQLGAMGAVIAGIVKWVNTKLNRINKLERCVFDEDGAERYVTKYKFNDTTSKIMNKLDQIADAVNLVNEVQMVELDVQIETCLNDDLRNKLIKEKEKLHKRRGLI